MDVEKEMLEEFEKHWERKARRDKWLKRFAENMQWRGRRVMDAES